MRWHTLALVGTLGSSQAVALDICPIYSSTGTHTRDVAPRIRSGIPFKLLSVAVNDRGVVLRRIVRLEYDLWEEKVTIEVLGHGVDRAKDSEAEAHVCRALSFPDAPVSVRYQYRLFLNPVLGEGLKRLRSGGESDRAGWLQVNWDSLVKDLETEKVLLEHEYKP